MVETERQERERRGEARLAGHTQREREEESWKEGAESKREWKGQAAPFLVSQAYLAVPR